MRRRTWSEVSHPRDQIGVDAVRRKTWESDAPHQGPRIQREAMSLTLRRIGRTSTTSDVAEGASEQRSPGPEPRFGRFLLGRQRAWCLPGSWRYELASPERNQFRVRVTTLDTPIVVHPASGNRLEPRGLGAFTILREGKGKGNVRFVVTSSGSEGSAASSAPCPRRGTLGGRQPPGNPLVVESPSSRQHHRFRMAGTQNSFAMFSRRIESHQPGNSPDRLEAKRRRSRRVTTGMSTRAMRIDAVPALPCMRSGHRYPLISLVLATGLVSPFSHRPSSTRKYLPREIAQPPSRKSSDVPENAPREHREHDSVANGCLPKQSGAPGGCLFEPDLSAQTARTLRNARPNKGL